MDRRIRAVKIELQDLVTSKVIDDFRFVDGRKHPKVSFLHGGVWHTVPFSASATCLQPDQTRQGIRRLIRGYDARVHGL